MFTKITNIALFCLLVVGCGQTCAQSDFIEEIKDSGRAEKVSTPAAGRDLPGFAQDAVPAADKNVSSSDGKVCSYCGGSGVCEIAGEKITCPVCNGTEAKETVPLRKEKDKKEFPKVKSEDRLPWDPAHAPSDPLPVKRGGNAAAEKTKAPSSNRFRADNMPPAGDRLVFISAREVPAGTVRLSTIWGNLSFASQGAYHSDLFRGPGFSISIPKGWRKEEKPHVVLGGTQHRYTASDGLSYIVVVTFPLNEEVDLSEFLQKKHVRLLSSFKNRSAQKVILGRRKGIGAFYEGILMMRDAACNLFFTRYKKKGYMVYGLYFDHEGGMQISQIINSLRIY
ncbi:MAG: hypothetical protein ACYTFY_02715 [Planctomycetota bacterium]|jgi:hypothetical protein